MNADKAVAAAQGDTFRERIVQASVELIREQGLGALSMREVARRAGVSHQAPYHHFTDREAILSAIAEQGFGMLHERMRAARALDGDPVLGRVLAAGEAYLSFAFEQREHFRIMFRPELASMERHPSLKQAGDRACDMFFQVVREAVAAGLPRDGSLESLFLLCWSVGHGLACLVLDGPLDVVMPNQDRQAQVRDVLAMFRQLLRARIALEQPPLALVSAAPPAAGRGRRGPPTKRGKLS